MSISAIGSIAAGLVVAGLRLDPRKSLAASVTALGIALTVFGAAPSYAWFVVFCLPLGFASAAFLTVDTIVLQQATDPEMQGRVMGLRQIAWFGSTPIGALLMGWLIEVSSPRVPFFVGGVSAVVCGVAIVARSDQARGATAVDQAIVISS